jgi:hypothetical protein
MIIIFSLNTKFICVGTQIILYLKRIIRTKTLLIKCAKIAVCATALSDCHIYICMVWPFLFFGTC